MNRLQQGFTALELMVTVAVIAVFAGGALFFVHEKTYTAELHDAQRLLDIASLSQALQAYVVDNGSLPPGLTNDPQIIGSEQDELDLCPSLVPKYMKDVPLDPALGAQISLGTCAAKGSFYTTGYTVQQAKDGTVTIGAPTVESGTEALGISRKF